jgi:hypothetical protein
MELIARQRKILAELDAMGADTDPARILLQRQENLLVYIFRKRKRVARRASEAERLQSADVRNHLATGQATATDEHDMATIAMVLI